MTSKITDRKIVIVNQAVNYLTIGLANAFFSRFEEVCLITGSVHQQGEALDQNIKISKINYWHEKPARKKLQSYIIGAIKILFLLKTKYRGYEVFFVSVPPMSYLLGLFGRQKFSVVIWDVYPDAFKITGIKEKYALYRLFRFLNIRALRKSYKIFTISEVMADLLSQYVDIKRIIVLPIWSIFQEKSDYLRAENPFIVENKINQKFIVQYSGNIGLTHRVEVMVMLAEKMKDHENILFQIIGRGPRKAYLKKMVKEKDLPNCQFLSFQSDEMFPYSLSAADMGVVVLDAITAKGSVPSKSYNLMSFGIPALYIASDDSQLYAYADKYKHASCYNENELDKAVKYILEMATDKEMYERLSANALEAAKDFKRGNADKFVEKYLEVNEIKTPN